MPDPYDSKPIRAIAFLVVAVPLVLLVSVVVFLRAAAYNSGGMPMWNAIGLSALLFAGFIVWGLLVYWIARKARR